MTFQQFRKQWDDYLAHWYAWRRNPGKAMPADGPSCYFSPSNFNSGEIMSNVDYMPEPYYTGDSFVNAMDWEDLTDAVVVLDLNPGLSHPNDKLKSVSYPNALIVNRLASGTYSDVNKDFSPFISAHVNIPGVQWWDANRLNWISRFFDEPKHLLKRRMFALEMCPFHSKKWDCKILRNPDVVSYINDSVIYPAARSLQGRFGLCFGKDWELIFGVLDFREVGFWGVDFDGGDKENAVRRLKGCCHDWPEVAKGPDSDPEKVSWPLAYGKPSCRKYILYEGSAVDPETQSPVPVYFLCMRAEGSFKSPSARFSEVEKVILDDIRNII